MTNEQAAQAATTLTHALLVLLATHDAGVVAGAAMRVSVIAARTATKEATLERMREHLAIHWQETSELNVAASAPKGPQLVRS